MNAYLDSDIYRYTIKYIGTDYLQKFLMCIEKQETDKLFYPTL